MKFNIAWYWILLMVVAALALGYWVPKWTVNMKDKNKSDEDKVADAEEAVKAAEKRMSMAA